MKCQEYHDSWKNGLHFGASSDLQMIISCNMSNSDILQYFG